MQGNYLIVHKSILPDYYEKVLQVRRLMESGRVREVSQAVVSRAVSQAVSSRGAATKLRTLTSKR